MTVSFEKKTKPYSHWEYSNPEFDSSIRIVPERGGLITEWRSEGKELLYFDLDRFLDRDKSVRGGIPILFPICGDLSEGYLSCLLYTSPSPRDRTRSRMPSSA